MAKIQPLGNRILVKQEKKTETKSGIVLPDSAQPNDSLLGEVLAVGPGPRSPMTGEIAPIEAVKAGDYVMFSRHSGTELKMGDQELLALREEDLIGVLVLDNEEDEIPT